MANEIRRGTVVKLRHGVKHRCPAGRANHRTARVQEQLTNVEGGLFMERDLRGCRYWNVEDVELA